MIVATLHSLNQAENERLQGQIDDLKAFYGVREQRLENLLA
jgi:hypothetical protein